MSSLTDLIQKALTDADNYDAYMSLMDSLVAAKKSTGIEQSEALANYTMLNHKRMQRLNKTLKIPEQEALAITNHPKALCFLVLTESWCGDAAQSIPMWAKLATLNPSWELLLVSRDSHPALMEMFLTQGAKSIPKVLVLDAISKTLIADWGPRPSSLSQMVSDFKAAHGSLTAEFKTELQQWYNKDKGQTTLADAVSLLT